MPIINALSIDVEDYFHASALRVSMDSWSSQSQRVVENTRALLEILSAAGTQGTFFVLGWVAERYPELVREIAGLGHEVACHGYSHKLIYEQSRPEFTDETKHAKAVLEDLCGVPVRGYRAASFSIVEETRWALDVLAELGFEYDSSIFPVRHDRYGIRDADPNIHELRTGSGPLLEIPPSVLELGKLRIPMAGGGYFRLYPYSLTKWAIKRVHGAGRPVIFYMHPWELDVDQPRVDAGRLSSFRHYVNLGKVRSRLRQLLQDFEFRPISAIIEQAKTAPAGAGRVNGITQPANAAGQ